MSKQQMQHSSTAHTIAAFFVGSAIGAVAMLLYAPASGSEVRSRIAGKASELKDQAADWTGQVADKAVEWKNNTMSTAQDTIDRATATFKGGDGVSATGHNKMSAKA